ncbi:MAG: glycosyltransferase family 4 protein [Candidatus ainarchaeum sp.]|nr:glycosyltransferase family 4 protein [Candidatus ainarchaeum sp.]
MKIAMVLSTFPPVTGGAGSSCEAISIELAKRGHIIHIFTQKFSDYEKDAEERDGLKIFRVKTPYSSGKKGLLNFYKTARILSKKLKDEDKKENYDIIHSHEVTIGNTAVFLYNYFKKKKTILKYGGDLVYEVLGILNVRGWDPKEGYLASWKFNNSTGRLMYNLEKKMINSYTAVYSNNEYGKWLLEKEMKVNKIIEVIRNPVDVKKFRPSLKQNEVNRKYGKNIILSTARFVPWKGLDILIDAFKKINNKKFTLVIIGDGPYSSKLKEKAGNAGNIKIIPSVSHEDIIKYYQASTIYAQPSYFDPNPNSLLEAMACGKACIATDISTIREVISAGNTGLLFEKGNSDSLAEKIMLLIKNKKLRERIGKNSRRQTLEKSSIYSISNQVEKMYRKTAGG